MPKPAPPIPAPPSPPPALASRPTPPRVPEVPAWWPAWAVRWLGGWYTPWVRAAQHRRLGAGVGAVCRARWAEAWPRRHPGRLTLGWLLASAGLSALPPAWARGVALVAALPLGLGLACAVGAWIAVARAWPRPPRRSPPAGP